MAVRVLTRVLSDHANLDDALGAVFGEVSEPARGWLQEVCSGTLRWKGRLDQVIDSIALKKKPSGWLRKILLIAAYQLVVQEKTSPGAVVSETVNEVKRQEGEAPARFANALLRKVAEHGPKWREQKLRSGARTAEAAAWASLPEWLWAKLVKQQGLEWAREYAQASLERPSLWVRVRENVPKDLPWLERTEEGPVPGSRRVPPGGIAAGGLGPVHGWAGFREGEFFVQDISSQILIHDVVDEVKRSLRAEGKESIEALDLCAAPGGKSVGMNWSGLKVVASDRDAARLMLLRQTVDRVAPDVQVVQKNEIEDVAPPLDLVWVDAPCTGTGILRRHPDVRWLRREKDLASLLKAQQELIAEGWTKVRPGGYFAYSVCSVLEDEGLSAIQKAGLKSHLVRTWSLAPQSPPHGDGFWCALLRKQA